MDDLIPTPTCSYWGLFSAISCGIQHASVGVLNWLLSLSGINLLIRPIADIAKTTINFTKTAFLVFEFIPAFQMLFEFVVPLAILLILIKKYELVFTEILNSELWLNSPAEGSYRLHFPNDILPNDLKKKNLFLKGQDNIENVLNFYKKMV